MAIYRVNVNQLMFNQQFMNVYYYDIDASLGSADAVDIADAFRSAYAVSAINTRLANDWAFTGVTLRRVDIGGLPEFIVNPTSGTLVGGSSSDPLPSQVAMLIRGQANTTFPRRCRTYLAGMTEGTTANGLWGTAAADAGLDFVEANDEITITAGDIQRVAVRLEDSEDGPVVADFNRIEEYTTTLVPATQRRRRIGVGS